MQDLFERVTLADFMKEEAKALAATADAGMVLASVQIGTMLRQFTTDLITPSMLSGYDPAKPDQPDGAKAKETMERAYGLLAVGAALGLRDMSQRLGKTAEFPEVDLLVSWYRNRWPR